MSGVMIFAVRFSLESVPGPLIKCQEKFVLNPIIVQSGAQQLFDIEHAVVVEACLKNTLSCYANAIATSAKCTAKGGDDAHVAFVARNLVMKRCGIFRIGGLGYSGKMLL